MRRYFLAVFFLLIANPVLATWSGQGYTEDVSADGGEKFFSENTAGTVNNYMTVDTIGARVLSGNAATATALAANGANCSAGSYPLGVDASGASESCTDATTEIDSAITTASSNYEPADAAIVKSDEAETITAAWYFSGLTTAKINVESFATGTAASAQQVSGSYIIATAAMVLTLPTAVEGYSFCYISEQGSTAIIQITPASGDYLVVDGVRGTIATAYASSGAAGDKICLFSADATDWYVTSEVGTWSE